MINNSFIFNFIYFKKRSNTMKISTWVKNTVGKWFTKDKKDKEVVVLEATPTISQIQTPTINETQGEPMSTSGTIKEKLIAMAIPLALKLAERELPKLIDKYLSAEKIDIVITKGLDILKKKVKETPNEWDDVLTKPFINLIEEVFGLSSEANLQSPTDTSSSVEEVIAQKVAETVLDSIKL